MASYKFYLFEIKNNLKLKSQLASFEWFYMSSTNRPLVDESNALAANLTQLNLKSAELAEKLANFEANIIKRLEWAASTNVSLRDVQINFESGARQNQSAVSADNNVFSELVDLVNGWTSFEKLRVKSSECEREFEAMLRLIEETEAVESESNVNRQLSEVELNLIQFHKFKEKNQLNTGIIKVKRRELEVLG